MEMAYVFFCDGMTFAERSRAESSLEEWGHDFRQRLDPRYRYRTWGRRPKDIADSLALRAQPIGVR